MKWNDYDFVLSADAQFNGSSQDYIPNLAAYAHADLKTEYQTVVSKELGRVLRTNRDHESVDQSACAHIRGNDDRLSFPAEFFQCMLQKPQHYVDFRGRVDDVINVVRNQHVAINDIFDHAFFAYAKRGAPPQKTIHEDVDRRLHADAELKGILKGYLTQMPQRAIFLIDVESSPASFQWLEPVYQTIKWHLTNLGLDHIASVSGKGYHFLSQIPLYNSGYGLHDGRGHLNYAMLNLMARGGIVQPETMDKLVSIRWGSRKKAPAAILAQRAYQGMCRLQQWLMVNIVDDIRKQLWQAKMAPWVNFTDNQDETVILDLTGMLRYVEMGVFGSVGSLYSKARHPFKVRLVRSRNGHEYFGNRLDSMFHTRSDLGAAKMHLVHAGGRIPDGSRGIETMLRAYDSSRLKRELHVPCDRYLSADRIRNIFHSNYRTLWRRCPQILHHVQNAQPNFLNPKCLEWIYQQMSASRFSVHDMMTITKSVYCDPAKHVDIDSKYSKDEWARWPMLLLGERFKG
jgi:hypothetical protein